MVELDETESDFSSPSYCPGPETTITFENGTEVTRQNTATTRKNFSSVEDGASFYHEFCNATNKEDPDDAESSAEEQRADDDFPYSRIAKRESLEALFETDDGTVSTFILPETDDSESTAVIAIARFSNELFSIQETMSNFLDECREQNVKHLVVDLSSNTGGNVMATYEIFKHVSSRTPSRRHVANSVAPAFPGHHAIFCAQLPSTTADGVHGQTCGRGNSSSTGRA